MTFSRREFLRIAGASAAAGTLAGYGRLALAQAKGNVVVVGGGFGGATTAKYLRMWSNGGIDVTLVERNPNFVSCPISNLVISGDKKLEDITLSYDGLAKKHGVKVVQGEVAAVDAEKKQAKLGSGESLAYDRLVMAPGIDFMYEQVPGLTKELSESTILHAWKAGPQTVALRKQIEEMKDGGVVAICIPKMPYRCPPGPYERACLIAHYLKANKPKSKVLILDANEDVVSKKGLFMKVWAENYGGIVEYRKEQSITGLDAATRTVKFDFGDPVKADVLNVIPPQMAGALAKATGLVNQNNRWCGVDWLSLESTAVKNIHVVGDSTFPAPGMPKSGHMANQQAKVVAAAIVNLMSGQAASDQPLVMNTCYSLIDPKKAVHVAGVYGYDAKEKTFKSIPGAGGVSAEPSDMEGKFAYAWAKNIWADSLN
jgi:sulfite dehydrogenase